MIGDGIGPRESAPTVAAGERAGGGDVVIEARGLRKVYHGGAHEVEALRGLDLVVPRGEIVAIMGPSGCGKTTLLNCLSGLDDIDGGDVLIEGVSLAGMNDRQRTDYRARRMGFVFQSFNLLPVLSAAENVELPLLLIGWKAKAARKRALEMLAVVGLTERASHRPAELSGGQQQRVAVARALTTEPAIIWADEPTGNLDTESASIVMDLMLRLNAENGQTFVLVTHSREVADLAHRIVHMRDGRIVDHERVSRAGGRLTPCDARPSTLGGNVAVHLRGLDVGAATPPAQGGERPGGNEPTSPDHRVSARP